MSHLISQNMQVDVKRDFRKTNLKDKNFVFRVLDPHIFASTGTSAFDSCAASALFFKCSAKVTAKR